MAKYKILVIGLLVASNTVKPAGDIVDEKELLRPASDLLKEGYIELVEEDAKKSEDPIELPIPGDDETIIKKEDPASDPEPPIEDEVTEESEKISGPSELPDAIKNLQKKSK
ncbi:MAG TPA: hypothetical protein VK541_04045 [Pedobacter sp.]|uniref:hypothetical protein n=1 Tax=Pedobacter sp. TaxID=1411316 RepID=UPI002B61BB6E|nr:hypothetical protein [Pedobacter sp.]HMI01626.1 hypothetical protein [Pedobacter sp.]